MVQTDNDWPLRVSPEIPGRPSYPPVKRALEYGIALVLLVLSAPVILLAALLLKLTSPGPAFYWQVRLGKNGRPFHLVKIRTMIHDCEKTSGPRWSSGRRDPRVTPVGRFLRLTHLDELPQLWNVLRGDMCLVGPRPERPEFVARLANEIPHYRERLRVHPGLTGLAQVQLPADTDVASVRRKLAYDLHYIRHMGFWLDLRLLSCTGVRMAGVPISIITRLFFIPSQDVVEHDSPSSRPAPSPCPSCNPCPEAR